jgi:sigma-B regulation protein RsbU (phosphoserine phosphatase)
LLPSSFPNHLIRRIASRYIPAGMVGGDYYDCFELDSNRLGIVVADVSGHGIGAALVMSMFKVLLRTFSTEDPSPCSVLNRINATFMQQQLGSAKFVTVFYAIFDKQDRTFLYCNAGHVAQLLRHDAGLGPPCMMELTSSGLVLGMFADTFLQDATVDLAPQARLFLFTDGITEAHGVNGKMFGIEPLMELALGSNGEHPAALIDALMQTRTKFLGGSEQASGELADDATVVILDL